MDPDTSGKTVSTDLHIEGSGRAADARAPDLSTLSLSEIRDLARGLLERQASHENENERLRRVCEGLNEARKALEESEERYRTVSRLTSEYIFRVDISADGQISLNMASDRFSAATGRTIDETRTPEHWKNIVHPDEAAGFFAHLQKAIAQGGKTEYEGRFFVKGGQLRWVHVFAEAVWDTVENRTTSIVGAVSDISERKRAEAERQALQDQLIAVNQELGEALRLKDEFLSSMSHELRTPLNAILGFTQAVREQVYGEVNDRMERAARAAEDAGRHLLDLINDILDLSKIQAGRLTLEPGLVPVRSLCEASLQMVEKAAFKKKIPLVLTADPAATTLIADGRRVKQMLVNLLSNAVKFTSEGGRVELSVTADDSSGVIRFAVTDTGIGIAEDEIPRLFQPFTQFDSRLSRQHSGTGLGLSLVLNMATLHGGGVEVKSRPGQGSCFTISLPWSGNASPSPTPQNRPAPEDGPLPAQHHDSPERVARILITEDNESNAMMLSDFLSSRGYEVAIARSGLESLRLIRELKPDLVLMDVQMPGMDGLEVMRRIRSQEGLARIPIIAITALAMPGDRERCLSAGADGYLTKPLELAELARFIGRCL